MERGTDIRNFLIFFVTGIIITGILGYTFAREVNNATNQCRRMGGFIVHGNGGSLCVKLIETVNE